LKKNYAVRDKQDVLAMCSLQYAAQLEKSNNQNHTNSPKSEDKIEELIDMIDIHLTSY
jgi:cell division protein ZapA